MFKRPTVILVRKRTVFLALLAVIILFIGAWSLQLTSVLSSNLKDKVIVIDPGHGGADPGAQNSELKEKDVNLDISLRLSKVLATKGCTVILTRDVDKDFFLPGFVKGRMAKRIELNSRIEIANKNNADLFISVHANSFPKRNSYGMETYHHLDSPSGKALAELIQEQLTLLQSDNKRTAKAGDYYVIKQAKIPSVIVEVGFISNPRERKLLLSENYRDLVADAIGAGVENYFNAFPMGVRESSTTFAHQEGPPSASGGTYRLYFSNDNFENLVPEERQMDKSLWSKLTLSQKPILILNELIRGPQSEKLTSALPQTTQILSLSIQNGLATINFSKNISDDFPGGAVEEDITIRSIVWSLTQIPGIDGVNILINGEYGESIGGHILLDHTFTAQPGV